MAEATRPNNFIKSIIDTDIANGKHGGRVHTRFPPEPNGFLHIGHAKSICLNFGLAQEYNGKCNLRFDDTNPAKEEVRYVQSIREDVKWLGFDWDDRLYYASDYFEKLYEFAVILIKAGKAYVCSLTADEIRDYRGTLTEPGRPSPYRNRSVADNLSLFERMRNGEFPDGAHVLRAKIDMASPNINMRDPTIYRIRRMHHHQTGDKWCIYPMYDYTHCISDALEGITHSICTLEFEDHRPLYDWCIDQLPLDCHPQQIEFARLEINYTVMSKRKLLRLVEEKHVAGWDDPRMPTIAGMRRRGYPAAAIRDFCNRIGVARAKSCVDVGLLEFCVREELFRSAKRALGVVKPIKLVIEDFPADRTDWSEMPFHPEKPELGTRKIPITREMWIESDDYMDSPPKDYFRLAIGREVRLRYGYIVKCERVDRDANGNVTTIFCSHDPSTLGKNPADGRKVKGIIHWVSAKHAQEVEVRLYDRLFQIENPEGDASKDFVDFINPQSLVTCKGFIEPGLENLRPGESVQLERLGYFVADSVDTAAGKIVLNKTVGLRDTYTPPK